MKKLLVASALASLSSVVFAQSTTLTGTVRDFTPSTNSDFEAGIGGWNPGMVSPTLTGTAPTYIGTGGYGSVGSAASFAQWYGPAAPSTSYAITLNETAPGSGIYSYSNYSFFPIDGQLLGNYAYGHNYHFTYQIAATFGYNPGTGQTFSFAGDDDVWVYFDKKLGIDLGGIHGSTAASVNLDTLFGPGKAAGNYAFDFFFAERHTTGSNLTIQTSLNLVTAPPPPVPEPETYAMLLAGLGLLGFTARRRKQKFC
ncbi:MAG: fibro-slime domain-containing protein [Nitrosomonadales bacterium]|nr:fibro-slime domain-containing protein [Nitrosomonadales bacterium]